MQANVGVVDRVLRGAFAVLVAIFYLLGTLSGPLAVVLGVAAVILLVTSALGWCPLYALTGIKTFKQD